MAGSRAGSYRSYKNRPDAAIRAFERAIGLSPLDPWGGRAFTLGMALAHFAAGRYDEGSTWADRSPGAQPDHRPALRLRASCCAHLGRVEEARDSLSRVLELEPGLTIAGLKPALKHLMAEEVLARYVTGLRKAGLPEQ